MIAEIGRFHGAAQVLAASADPPGNGKQIFGEFLNLSRYSVYLRRYLDRPIVSAL